MNPAAKTKRRISLLPTRSERGRGAFTLLEVLIALGVALVLVTVVCGALVVSLQAEAMAEHLADARYIMQRLATASHLNHETEPIEKAYAEQWYFHDTVEPALPPERPEWRVWELTPKHRPSMALRFAVTTE